MSLELAYPISYAVIFVIGVAVAFFLKYKEE